MKQTFQNNKRENDRRANREKKRLLNPESYKKEQEKRKRKSWMVVFSVLAAIFLISVVSIMVVRAIGERALHQGAGVSGTDIPVLNEELPPETTDEETLKKGEVLYQGKKYAYNEEILTFLVMGIDKLEGVHSVAEGTKGGQADALFLLVLNPKKKDIRVIGINRNTMTPVDIYDEMGAYVETVTTQLCIQHGFGDGVEKSCMYQVDAVRRLLYQLPIHGYASINMSAIPTLNDAVGGVTLTVLEDLTKWDPSLVQGENVHLMGQSAYVYLSRRDVSVFGSADNRLKRQKQYLESFIAQTKQKTASDLSVAQDLYLALTKYMVTDITLDEVMYLAPIVKDYSFDKQHIYTFEGETKTGTDPKTGKTYEEFYPDRDALYQVLLEVFYEEIS